MTYTHLPKNLPTILRAHGLHVVEIEGWEDRGRPASTGGFDPDGVLCHHTGELAKGWSLAKAIAYAKGILRLGRSDLPGPLCHLSLAVDGTVIVEAAGRANHAGVAKASGTMPGGDGNFLYIGIEAQNSGSQGWTKEQYDAYVLLCAVLCVYVTGNSAQTVRAHKETSVTGKWDPGMIDMDKFRAEVALKMVELRRADAKPARVAVPKNKSLVQQFKDGVPAYDLNLLNTAVANGRTGVVKEVRNEIRAEVMRLTGVKSSPEIKAFLDSYGSHKLVRLGLLTAAVSKGRRGTVKSVRDNIRASIKKLDAVR